ncbi:hypothetical protein [Polymorphobacter fuscus]|uniref:Transposase n=1 Tax=Sandarakinorhabdus fusca TaxID=1439888 RepID=A0A7C9KP87_9SPHN|nr:hypothetical protein [Polymorphobacter fuscus]KAB7644404.1 hypothetical protein F9290_13795 [Polymorphobacter fuscus]MQT18324.1 hypothetical protein [Polymorphobacter fuscus]NJC08223.1 transposase-like protein [Polymorphobacter fuscus]
MRKTKNKNKAEVRERAVRLVLVRDRNHELQQVAVVAISAKIGCAAQTLHNRAKKAEVDAGGRTRVPTEVAAGLTPGAGHRSAMSTKAMAIDLLPVFWTVLSWKIPV